MIALLAQLAGMSELRADSRPLRSALRVIRRAAGSVRDFDAHRELLGDYAKSRAAAAFDDKLRHLRKKAAHKLQQRLKREERKMCHAFEKLEAALQQGVDLKLSGDEIAAFARSWFASAIRGLDVEEDDQLHAIRKACKTARYLAEQGAEDSKDAAITAARFERVQASLGAWHDHLLLRNETEANSKPGCSLVREIEADVLRLRQQASAAAKRVMESSSNAEALRPAAAQKQRRRRRDAA